MLLTSSHRIAGKRFVTCYAPPVTDIVVRTRLKLLHATRFAVTAGGGDGGGGGRTGGGGICLTPITGLSHEPSFQRIVLKLMTIR